jgi:hypothetical protein
MLADMLDVILCPRRPFARAAPVAPAALIGSPAAVDHIPRTAFERRLRLYRILMNATRL